VASCPDSVRGEYEVSTTCVSGWVKDATNELDAIDQKDLSIARRIHPLTQVVLTS
jgi:hypothetical protein